VALTWLDLAAGASFLAVAATAWRASRRYAVVAVLAALTWFAGDLGGPALLIHRPLMLQAGLSYPSGRPRDRFVLIVLAVSWVGALVPSLGRSPAFTLCIAVLTALEAARLWSDSTPGGRRATVTAACASAVLALSLAVPSAARLLWANPPSETLIALYDSLIMLAGLVLLTGMLRSSAREPDAVIELSDRTPDEVLAALRAEANARSDGARRAQWAAAVELLESNAALQADLADRVAEVRASRVRLVEAAIEERRRLEQILADGALKYLDKVSETLQPLATSADAASTEMALACLAEIVHIRSELDLLSQGLHPRTLSEQGLAAALADLASRSPVPLAVHAPPGRFPTSAETAVWYACAEALANLGKHARASHAAIDVQANAGELVARVRDDGVGGARITPGGGLAGLVDRLGAVGGRLAVRPAPGRGTDVQIRVPLR
jgi:signal transduction histidine kinase